jgi:putative aminopeptidase FrvX
MNRKQMLELLSKLIACHSPPGNEQEIDKVIRSEFEAARVKVWTDEASNIYAHLPGTGPKIMVCAHKDEIGMIVTRVHEDGRLSVRNIGGARPWKYGEGPVDLLADDGKIVPGILSVGSVHTSGPVRELDKDRALTWDMVTIFTGLSPEQLDEKGIHIGSRAVVARERKEVQRMGEYIASFALDDRMGLVAIIAALREMSQTGAERQHRPNVTFVATHGEEVGMLGGARAAQLLEPKYCVALDTSPVAPDVPVKADARPVIWYAERSYHDKEECDRLVHLARAMGLGVQPVVYEKAASDAARVKQLGLADKTVAFGFARDNSHGFEIAHADSLDTVTRLLVAYLWQLV